jgi:hypothetical protein
VKDRDLAALRKKEQSFLSTVESMQIKLDAESSKHRDSDGQVRIRILYSNVNDQIL